MINEESQRMSRLVRELLDLARIESGHIQIDPTEVPLDEFIQRVIRKFQGLAKESNVHFLPYSEKNPAGGLLG